MKKHLWIALLSLILFAFSVSAAGNLTITGDPFTDSGNVSESITHTITFNNTDTSNDLSINLNDTIDFVGTNHNLTGVSVTYNASNPLNLTNGTTQDVNLTYTVPSDAFNETYTGTLLFTTGQTGTYDDITITLTVNANDALSAGTPASVTIVQGYSGNTSFAISNTGNTDLGGLAYSVTDLTSGSNTLGSGNITFSGATSLSYQGTDSVNVTVAVPSDQTAGTYNGTITISEDGVNLTTATLTVVVDAATADIEFLSTTSGTWVINSTTSETLTTVINNTGTIDTTLNSVTVSNFTLSGAEDITGVSVSPSSVTLTPGQDQTYTITVTGVPENQTAGTYSGTLTANYTTSTGTTTETQALSLSVEAVSYDMTATGLTFASTDQNSTVSTTVTITNAGNMDLTGVTVVNSSVGSEHNISFSSTSLGTITAGSSQTVTVTVDIPDNENSGSHTIGNIEFQSNEYNESFALTVDVTGKLTIDDLDVKVGSSTDSDVTDGETINKKAAPGDQVDFKFKIENDYTDSEDIEIENIVVTVVIEGIDDDGDDLEEESDEFDLQAEDDKKVTVSFDLPNDAAEGNYDVIITVEGEGENGVDHEIEWNLELEVDRESHEVTLSNINLASSTLSCSRSTSLSVTALNIGSRDEDEVVMTIKNSDLDIDERYEFELESDPDDDDNKYSKTISIDVADDVEAGTYPVEVKLYYDTDELDDYGTADVEITDCETSSSSDDDDSSSSSSSSDTGSSSTTVVVTGGSDTTDSTPQSTVSAARPTTSVTSTAPVKFSQTGGYTAVLILANLVAFGGIALLIAKFFLIGGSV